MTNKCQKCGNPINKTIGTRDNPKLCFSCTIDELTRLREQEERVNKKLDENPEIMELLDVLTVKEILNRLKERETVEFT